MENLGEGVGSKMFRGKGDGDHFSSIEYKGRTAEY